MNEARQNLSAMLARTRAALVLLATSSSEQIVYLQDLGVGNSADELALELSEGVLMLDQFQENSLVSDEQVKAIVAVDKKLAEMSGPERAHLWTWNALEHSLEWTEVRELASEALLRLNHPGTG